MTTPTVVLVHGAWYGTWAWDEVRRHLDDAGVPSAIVALPSVGERLGGLTEDVAAITTVLDELTGPVVLVGHSYAGLPMGTTLLDAVGGRPPDWWIHHEDGKSILPEDPRAVFFAEAQRACAALAGAVTVALDTDHSPMLSRPTELATALTRVAARHPALP